jgi:hypothetical protein
VCDLPDFNSMWFCPKDKIKLQERTFRNQGGKFLVNVNQPETGINNALAVRKISEEQREKALELSQGLMTQFPDKRDVTLVSVECPICGFKSIAPDLATLGGLKSSDDVRKGQVKTVRSIVKQAEAATKQRGGSQGSRFSIWLLFIGFSLLASLGVVIYYVINVLLKGL